MSILIRGGTLLTMTEAGRIKADILIEGDRITRIAPSIPAAGLHCIHAGNGVVTPGLMDLCIGSSGEPPAQLISAAKREGITNGLLWRDGPGLCRMIRSTKRRFIQLQPKGWTDGMIVASMEDAATDDLVPAIAIDNPVFCRRLLSACMQTGVRVLLDLRCDCELLIPELAASGCMVIAGTYPARQSGPWEIAAKLHREGIPTAVSCRNPLSSMKYLRMYAALCYREGVSEADALGMITRIPADILGDQDAGSIAEGKRADLCIYDGDPLLLATSHLMTVSGGRIIQ